MNKKLLLAFFLFFLTGIFFSTAYPSASLPVDSLLIALHKAEKLCGKPCPADTATINLFNQISFELRSKNPDSSFLLAKKALSLSLIIGDEKGAGQSYLQLANFFWRKGDSQTSIETYHKAIKHFLNERDSNFLASAYGNLGNVYRDRGDFQQAFEYFTTALAMSKKINNRKFISAWSGNLGLAFSDFGDYPKAIHHYLEALKISEEEGNKYHIASWLGNIGVAYKKLNDPENAKIYYLKALSMFNELGDKQKISSTLNNLANIHLDNRQYDVALKYFNDAIELDKQIGNKNGLANKLGNIGTLYEKMYDHKKLTGENMQINSSSSDSLLYTAIYFYRQAVSLSREINSKNVLAINLGHLGTAYIQLKEYKTAEQYLKEALAISTKIKSMESMKEIHENLSQLYAQKKESFHALEHYKCFIASRDSLVNEEKSKAIGKLAAKHEIEMREIKKRQEAEKENKKKERAVTRRNTLQYSGSFIFIILLVSILFLSKKFRAHLIVGEGLVFFTFLLFFEFILILLDPFFDRWTGNDPLWKLLLNALVALCIFPAHKYFNTKIKLKLLHKPVHRFNVIWWVPLICLPLTGSVTSTTENDTSVINNLNRTAFELRFAYPDSSIACAEKALHAAMAINFLPGIAEAYRNLGVMQRLKGNFSEAFGYYEKSIEIFSNLNNLKGIASVHGNMAVIFNELGDFTSALKHYTEAIKIYKKTEDEKKLAKAYANLGITYWDLKDYAKAQKYYDESMKFAEKTNDRELMSYIYESRAFIESDNGNFVKAISNLQKAMNIDSSLENLNGIGRSFVNLASVTKQLGERDTQHQDSLFKKAEEYNFSAMKFANELGNHTIMIDALGNLGSLYFSLQKFNEAEKYVHEALNLSFQLGRKEVSWLYENLYIINEAQKKYDLAFENYKLYIRWKDTLFNEKKSMEFGKAEAKYEFEISEMERLRREEENKRLKELALQRHNNLVYSGVFIFIVILFVIVLISGKFHFPGRTTEAILFLTFLLLFEFLLVFFDPVFTRWTGGEPAFRLLLNVLIASLIFPVHTFMEKQVKKKIRGKI